MAIMDKLGLADTQLWVVAKTDTPGVVITMDFFASKEEAEGTIRQRRTGSTTVGYTNVALAKPLAVDMHKMLMEVMAQHQQCVKQAIMEERQRYTAKIRSTMIEWAIPALLWAGWVALILTR